MTITATSEGVNGTAQVVVTPAVVASLDVAPAIGTVNANERIQLSATPRDQQGGALTGRAVTWSSGDSGIAMVDDTGLVIGVAAGSVTITATSEGQSGTAALEVTPPVDALVESADGNVTLDIPAGALPAGVTAADIEIRDVSDDPDYLVETDGDPPLAVLLLEPLGLEFSQPVTLTVRDLPVVDPIRRLFVIHTFGNDAEIITEVVSEIDPDTNTLTASIPLTHFSAVLDGARQRTCQRRGYRSRVRGPLRGGLPCHGQGDPASRTGTVGLGSLVFDSFGQLALLHGRWPLDCKRFRARTECGQARET